MITKSKNKRTLDKVFVDLRNSGKDYTAPMTEFRHAIMHVIERCKLINETKWELYPETETCACFVIFNKLYVKCTYDYKNKENCVTLEEYDYACDTWVLSKSISCKCNDVPDIVYQWQPKLKIVIKRK